jgi:hypothetical protein
VPQAEKIAPQTPLRALAARWWIAALLVVIGVGVGVVAAYLTPTQYTAEARVAVGSQSLDARIVAGYSEASQQLASDIARYVNDIQGQKTLSSVLGDDRAAGVSQVAASPIPSSSVVRVEVTADTESAATEGAQALAENLVATVNAATSNSGGDALLQQYTDLSNRVAASQQAVQQTQATVDSLTGAGAPQAEIDNARAALLRATTDLDVLTVQQTTLAQQYRNAVTSSPAASGLRMVVDGQLEYTSRAGDVQRDGLAGGVLGLLIALFIAVRLDRRSVGRSKLFVSPGEERTAELEPDVNTSANKW